MIRSSFLNFNQALYERIKPLIFKRSADEAHRALMRLLPLADRSAAVCAALGLARRLSARARLVNVGGVALPHPLILAAGFVKGHGFESEAAALAAVEHGANIIPGWRSIPALVGIVEFGSFTRHPRLGNPDVVMWRDTVTRSTQNRVGLKNPGARAAAAFLARHRTHLPPVYGINVAVSPGVTDPDQQAQEVREAFAAFVGVGLRPAWFTLNLSCPNTEDDPAGNQTAAETRLLCAAARAVIGEAVPLWIKVSPELSREQYEALMRAAAETGVAAIIAANTLARPAPNDPAVSAGIGGGRLHAVALDAARMLLDAKRESGYPVDVIGCGGIEDGQTFADFTALGIRAAQYWSALVYRGGFAAALIEEEYERLSSAGAD